MNRSRWILATFLLVVVVASIFGLSDPERAARFAQARRDAALSADTKEIVFAVLALAIGGYLAWFMLIRRQD